MGRLKWGRGRDCGQRMQPPRSPLSDRAPCLPAGSREGACRRYGLGHLSFSVNPAPPFRLDLTVWAIRRRPQNAVDHWDGETYRGVLAIRGKPVLTTVAQLGDVNAPRLDVTASCAYIPTVARSAVTAALDRLLGLHVDLKPFYQLAAEHSPLHELASRFRGLKPPRFPTVWEGLVNGIACQQFSLTVGIQSHPEKWLEFRSDEMLYKQAKER
jgi:hypothetical protein